MSKKQTAVKAMKPRTDADILRAIGKEVCEGSDVDALERVASRLDSDAKQDEKYQALQEIGKSAAASIAEMVAALECDYDRLGELKECLNSEPVLDPDETDELRSLEDAAGDCESREDAEQRIQEDPLSIEVRSGWHAPGEGNDGEHFGNGVKPEEFCILLSTGGPATRIIGELNEHCEPTRARLQAQDWFTQWTDYTGDAISQDDLLTYCRCFYFGE